MALHQQLDRLPAALLAGVGGGGGAAAGGIDPVLGGLIGTALTAFALVLVALIGRSGKATPAEPDEERVAVTVDEWELRVRESERWRAYQEEQAELRDLREDR